MYNDLVTKHMIHRPCKTLSTESKMPPCIKNQECEDTYPMQFQKHTMLDGTSFPKYKRRSPEDGGHVIETNIEGVDYNFDNRWILPHNRFILAKYKAGIPIEVIVQSRPIGMRHQILYLANRWIESKILSTPNRFLVLVVVSLLAFSWIPQLIARF